MLNTEKNVQVIIGQGVTEQEALAQTLYEIENWNNKNKKLGLVEITVDPKTDELVVMATEKSKITGPFPG